MNLIRACAWCEKEHGILNKADANKTHGSCRRHFIAGLRAANIAESKIQECVAQVESSELGFCPDLDLEVAA